jgi:hypothetical protein
MAICDRAQEARRAQAKGSTLGRGTEAPRVDHCAVNASDTPVWVVSFAQKATVVARNSVRFLRVFSSCRPV